MAMTPRERLELGFEVVRIGSQAHKRANSEPGTVYSNPADREKRIHKLAGELEPIFDRAFRAAGIDEWTDADFFYC